MSSSPAFVAPPPDHHHHHHHHNNPLPSSEQLCYVHCNSCGTVLAVSVPCTSFLKTVTVRCGHCTNLLSVDTRSHLLATGNQGYAENGSPTLGSSLEKLLDVNDSMSQCASPTASVTQESKRIRGNINSLRKLEEMLSEYKASGSMSPRVQLLPEKASIHGSISHMDDVINQAQATRATLGSQKSMCGDVQGKVQLSDRFPVTGAIKRKKSRDTLILSGVIAASLLIYWLSK